MRRGRAFAALLWAGLFCAASAHAGDISVTTDTVVAGGTAIIDVVYTPQVGDPSADQMSVSVSYDPAALGRPVLAAQQLDSGCFEEVPGGGIVTVSHFRGNGGPANGPQCRITFNVPAATAPGTYSLVPSVPSCSDASGVSFACNATPGAVIVVGIPEFDSNPPAGSTLTLNTTPGVSASTTIAVGNLGSGDLSVTPTGLSGSFSATPGGTTTIASRGSQTYTVTCNSSTPGTFSQTLTLNTNDADEAANTYKVDCNVNGPGADPTPPDGSTLTFSIVAGASANATVNFRNSGNTNLTVTPSATSAPFTVSPTGANTIAPGGNQGFTVTCSSTTTGSFTQSLVFSTDDPAKPTINYVLDCTVGSAGPTGIAIVSGDNQTGAPNTQLGQPLVVQLSDPAFGPGRLPPTDVTFSVIQGDVTFTENRGIDFTIASDSNGFAGANVNLGATPGPVVITASAAGYGSVTFNLAIRDPTPVARVLSIVAGNGQTARANQAGDPLVVSLTQQGQPVPRETIAWSVVEGTGVTLSAASSPTDATGRAEIGVRFGAQPTAATIEAREPQGAAVRFTIQVPGTTPGPGQQIILSIVSGDAQSGAAGTLADAPIVFEARGSDSAPIAGLDLSFSVTQGSATLSTIRATTDASGRASVTLRYGNTPGPVRIQVSAASGSVTGFATATVFAPTLFIVSGDGQQGLPGARLAQPLAVGIARPANAKGLAGLTVNWSVLAGGGSVSSATSTTDVNGRASVDYTLGPLPGVNQIRAAIAGVGSVVFTATATLPAGTVLELVSGNGQVLATNAASAPLVVRLRTGQTPIANARIRWSGSPASTTSVSSQETTTDAAGLASITATIRSPGPATITAQVADAANIGPVRFSLNSGVANTQGLDAAQTEVARALDAACPALAAQQGSLTPAQQDLLARCSELVVGSAGNPQSVADALEEMLANETNALNTAALAVQSTQFANLKARIAALRAGARGVNVDDLALRTPDGSLPLSFLPSSILAENDDDAGGADEIGRDFSRWGFFASGTVGRGDRDAGRSDPGFEFDTYGLTAGVDYRFSDALVFGAALGYNRNDTELNDDRGGMDSRALTLSAYGTWYHPKNYYADGVLTLGRNDFDLSRRIRYQIPALAGGTTAIDQVATASPKGDQVAFALSLGRDFNRRAWSYGPYARAMYTRLDFDGYTERASSPGAAGAGLVMATQARELKSLEGVVGGKVTYTMSTSWGVLMPYAQIEWLHQFEDDPESLVTRFANDPTGTPIVVFGDEIDRDYLNIGLGLSGVFANGRSAFAYYEHRAGQDKMSQDNLAIGIRIEF